MSIAFDLSRPSGGRYLETYHQMMQLRVDLLLLAEDKPLQETATNIFVSDALLFFPAFGLHLALALSRPALLLLRSKANLQATSTSEASEHDG